MEPQACQSIPLEQKASKLASQVMGLSLYPHRLPLKQRLLVVKTIYVLRPARDLSTRGLPSGWRKTWSSKGSLSWSQVEPLTAP